VKEKSIKDDQEWSCLILARRFVFVHISQRIPAGDPIISDKTMSSVSDRLVHIRARRQCDCGSLADEQFGPV
jgi:hypothetical protein